jgi:hypothetical protein
MLLPVPTRRRCHFSLFLITSVQSLSSHPFLVYCGISIRLKVASHTLVFIRRFFVSHRVWAQILLRRQLRLSGGSNCLIWTPTKGSVRNFVWDVTPQIPIITRIYSYLNVDRYFQGSVMSIQSFQKSSDVPSESSRFSLALILFAEP